MLLSFVLMTLALILLGPSEVLGIPDEFWIFLIGYSLLGLSQGFTFIPAIPEALDSVYLK